MNNFEYIRKTYNVPAKQGAHIRYNNRFGKIVSARYGYLRVRFYGEKRITILHPTDNIMYSVW